MKTFYVYILANRRKGAIYIGVTNHLQRRVLEHRAGTAESFTRKYSIKDLVYYEYTENINDAIAREKQLKNWHRQWKFNLIEQNNPDWKDLYTELFETV
jgi:putative endonuclease